MDKNGSKLNLLISSPLIDHNSTVFINLIRHLIHGATFISDDLGVLQANGEGGAKIPMVGMGGAEWGGWAHVEEC